MLDLEATSENTFENLNVALVESRLMSTVILIVRDLKQVETSTQRVEKLKQ